jgi:hypothetical protein
MSIFSKQLSMAVEIGFYKVSGPNLVTYLNRTPILEWGWLGAHLRTDHKKRNWTTCSEFVNHARFNSQHNWGACVGPYGLLSIDFKDT